MGVVLIRFLAEERAARCDRVRVCTHTTRAGGGRTVSASAAGRLLSETGFSTFFRDDYFPNIKLRIITHRPPPPTQPPRPPPELSPRRPQITICGPARQPR